MWSVARNAFRRTALAAFAGAVLAVGLGAISPESVQAATLYISEFRTGVTNAPGSDQAQIPPQDALTDQTVALSGTTAISAAFNSKTNAVMLMCDEGCSIDFGTSSATATTSNYLLQQGVPYTFGVSPGDFVAVIANSAGDTGAGGTTSNVQGTGTAGTPAGGVLTIQGQTSMVPIATTIDQTTPGTTNGVTEVPTAAATGGVVSVSSASVESNHVIKSSAGNLYGFSVTTGATAGFVFVSNTTAAPTAGGAAIAPVKCYVVAANSVLAVSYAPIPLQLGTGITIVFSTTGCFTNTASATAFISGDAK